MDFGGEVVDTPGVRELSLTHIERKLSNFDFVITCTGRTARPPKYLAQIVAGEMPEIDAMSVQAYYTWRLAANVDATIAIEQDGDAVVITARRGM